MPQGGGLQLTVGNNLHVQALGDLTDFDPLSSSGERKLKRDDARVLRAHAGRVEFNATPQDDRPADEVTRASGRRAWTWIVIGVDAARARLRRRRVAIAVAQGTARTELAAVPADAAVQRSQTPLRQPPLPKADHGIGEIWRCAGQLVVVRHGTGDGSRGGSGSCGSGSGSGGTVGVTAGAVGTWMGSTVTVRDGPGNVPLCARSHSSPIDIRSS